MKRRVAKKLRRLAVVERREALGHPKPCPPRRQGVLLVPDDYVGPVLVTTPNGREKVRYVDGRGRVWRDSHFWHGGGLHIKVHAIDCRVEPVRLLVDETATAPAPEALAVVSSYLVARSDRRQGTAPSLAVVDEPRRRAVGEGQAALLSAGLPRHLVVVP